MNKVFIVNHSSHDFSPAEEYGKLVILSNGPMSRYATNNIHRLFKSKMEGSSKDDYIIPCSLNIMNIIACAIFTSMHGKLNLLLFKDGRYLVRSLII